MNPEFLFDRLESQARALESLLGAVDQEQAGWKPEPNRWSILEVACHLLDEERRDFRVRLRILLERPGDPWPGIDPQSWVSEGKYAEKSLPVVLQSFREERAKSLEWLRSLTSPAWNNKDTHPIAGTFHAGDMLSAWVAHDLLHLRQLTRLNFDYLCHLAEPYSVRYAGQW